jgi:hypothetical protein
MDRDVALRIDGILMSIRGNLDALTPYVKNNCTDAEFKRIVRQIGATMAETIDISNALHQEHPDIVPRELRPK